MYDSLNVMEPSLETVKALTAPQIRAILVDADLTAEQLKVVSAKHPWMEQADDKATLTPAATAASPLAEWLGPLGLSEHVGTVGSWVSTATPLKDLRRMLELEQEDEEEEDLKDLIGEMELDVEAAAKLNAADTLEINSMHHGPKWRPPPR